MAYDGYVAGYYTIGLGMALSVGLPLCHFQ
jgi:hypothetical protein